MASENAGPCTSALNLRYASAVLTQVLLRLANKPASASPARTKEPGSETSFNQKLLSVVACQIAKSAYIQHYIKLI